MAKAFMLLTLPSRPKCVAKKRHLAKGERSGKSVYAFDIAEPHKMRCEVLVDSEQWIVKRENKGRFLAKWWPKRAKIDALGLYFLDKLT